MGDLDLCENCFNELPRNYFCCYRCGLAFESAIVSAQLCGRCISQSPHFDDTHAPFLYVGQLRYLVSQLKYKHQYKNARLLGSLLAIYLQNNVEIPGCLIPMHLHHSRYTERGFNQAIEISRSLSKQLHIPMDLYSCVRLKQTQQQTRLLASERQENMRNAFSVKTKLPYTHVAIVDDVMTTGATASALALSLKKSGVNKVDVWVCARA